MFHQVKQFILQRVSIPEADLEQSFQYATFLGFKKGDYIIRAGEYCRFIGFLNSGLIVATFIDEPGKELTSNFVFEDCFFTYAEGISSNMPSHKIFIALEDCAL